MRARSVRVIALAAVLTGFVAVASGPPVGSAAFPGVNGKIAFTRDVSGNADIWSMEPDGSNQTRLTTDLAVDGEPDWSADGTKIVFTSRRDSWYRRIWVMNADGTDQSVVTPVGEGSEFEGYDPSWSPDGTKIAFVAAC
jgi:TolB protein